LILPGAVLQKPFILSGNRVTFNQRAHRGAVFGIYFAVVIIQFHTVLQVIVLILKHVVELVRISHALHTAKTFSSNDVHVFGFAVVITSDLF